MADLQDVACAANTQTLVFSGVGQVILKSVSGGTYWLGDASVTNSTGIPIPNSPATLSVYVTSPDDLYVYNDNGSAGYLRVYHNL